MPDGHRNEQHISYSLALITIDLHDSSQCFIIDRVSFVVFCCCSLLFSILFMLRTSHLRFTYKFIELYMLLGKIWFVVLFSFKWSNCINYISIIEVYSFNFIFPNAYAWTRLKLNAVFIHNYLCKKKKRNHALMLNDITRHIIMSSLSLEGCVCVCVCLPIIMNAISKMMISIIIEWT